MFVQFNEAERSVPCSAAAGCDGVASAGSSAVRRTITAYLRVSLVLRVTPGCCLAAVLGALGTFGRYDGRCCRASMVTVRRTGEDMVSSPVPSGIGAPERS